MTETAAIATAFATVTIELVIESAAVFASIVTVSAGIMYLMMQWDDRRK